MTRIVKVKFPRILVSSKRHIALTKEARARGITLEELAEEKFSQLDNK